MDSILAPDAQTAPGAAPLPSNSNFQRQLGTRAMVGQYERAIEMAHQAGDEKAALELATQLRVLLAGPNITRDTGVQIGQGGFGKAMKEVVDETGKVGQVLGGIGTAPALAGMGVGGLFGLGDKRTAEQWKALRDASPYTQGGNLAGSAIMYGSGAIPTRAIGQGLRVTGVGSPGVVGAVSSRPGQVLDTALTSGAVNAATEPGDARERVYAGLTGGGMSAVGPAMMGSGQILRRNATDAGRRIAVGEGLRTELGNERADALAAVLRGQHRSSTMLGVRPSAAMMTDDPTLRVMESGSRIKNRDQWDAFDRQNAEARWNALLDRRGTDEALQRLRDARTANTAWQRNEAMDIASGTLPFAQSGTMTNPMLKSLTGTLDNLATGEMRPNQAVQTIVKYVRGELEKGVTPQQLARIRDELTEGIKAAPTSDLANAAKAARAQRMEVISAIDSTLDDLTGRAWSDYLRAYQRASPEITSKEALGRMVEALQRGQPAGAVPTAMGESAAWKTVGLLRDRFGQKQFGGKTLDRLTPEDRDLMNALVENLKRQADVMSSRGTLGSPTAQKLADAMRADAVTRRMVVNGLETSAPGAGLLASRAFDKQGRAAEEQLARLLQNPADLALALEKARLSQALMRGSGRASSSAGGAWSHSSDQ